MKVTIYIDSNRYCLLIHLHIEIQLENIWRRIFIVMQQFSVAALPSPQKGQKQFLFYLFSN